MKSITIFVVVIIYTILPTTAQTTWSKIPPNISFVPFVDNILQSTKKYKVSPNTKTCNFKTCTKELEHFYTWLQSEIQLRGGTKHILQNIATIAEQRAASCVNTKNYKMILMTDLNFTKDQIDEMQATAYILLQTMANANLSDELEPENLPIIENIITLPDNFAGSPSWLPDADLNLRVSLAHPNTDEINNALIERAINFLDQNNTSADMYAHWISRNTYSGGPEGSHVSQCDEFNISSSSFGVYTTSESIEPSNAVVAFDMFKLIHQFLHVLGCTHEADNLYCGFDNWAKPGSLMSSTFSEQGVLNYINNNNGSPISLDNWNRYRLAIESKGYIEVGPTYVYYTDSDNDGFGDPENIVESCDSDVPDGFADNNQDCDDSDPDINPDAIEIPNNEIDENCDGLDTTSSIDEIQNVLFQTQPNPVMNNMRITTEAQHFSFEIISFRGHSIGVYHNVKEVDLSHIESGIYIIKFQESGTSNFKFEKILKL